MGFTVHCTSAKFLCFMRIIFHFYGFHYIIDIITIYPFSSFLFLVWIRLMEERQQYLVCELVSPLSGSLDQLAAFVR